MSLRDGIPTRAELQQLLGQNISLTNDDFCELIELMLIYAAKFQEPAYSATEPRFITEDWIGFDNPRRAEADARRAVVEYVQDFWREAGGTAAAAGYDSFTVEHSGPLISLLSELFKLVSLEAPILPSEATLFHDLEFINTGVERTH